MSDHAGEIVLDAGDHLGETPIWSPAEQALYWINCENPPQLRRWDPATGKARSWAMPERIGGMALRRDDDPIVCLTSGVYAFDLASEALSLLAPSPWALHVHLHESCVDRSGRLWVGALDQSYGPGRATPGGGSFCRLDGNVLVEMFPHVTVANALAFSPDGKVMYCTDSMRRVVWRADVVPETGAILGMRRFVTLEKGELGDGAAVDEEGGYWIAIFGKGEVRRYLPDGTLDRTIRMPFSQPTKMAFGGPDLRTVYVTSGQVEGTSFEVWGQSGAICAFESDVKGLAEPYFAG